MRTSATQYPLIPAKAGIQILKRDALSSSHLHILDQPPRPMIWIPAFAGMSGEGEALQPKRTSP